MDNKDFKTIFNKIAKANGFIYIYSAWFKESNDSILVLTLQKSNYSNLFYLNIKTYIKGIFGKNYSVSKELVKNSGNIFRRAPKNFEDAFNLESELSELEREKEIENLFTTFLNSYSTVMLNKKQLIEAYYKGSRDFLLLPAVKNELELG